MNLVLHQHPKCTLIDTAMQTDDVIPKLKVKRIVIPQLDILTIRHSLLATDNYSESPPVRASSAPVIESTIKSSFSSDEYMIDDDDDDGNDEYKEDDYMSHAVRKRDTRNISNASQSRNSVRSTAHSLSLLIRSKSETKLDWDTVFEQHIKEDIEEIADNLPIVIGEDIETEALKVVNCHIAKRLSRLFRKYSNDNKDMLMDEASFEQLVADYLQASKVWVPKYIQTVTMIKLRYSVAQLQHSADYDAMKIGEKVSKIIAPYLLECFKVIESQIDDMSQDDEVVFIRKFCFEQMCKEDADDDNVANIGKKKFIDCKSFVTLFPTLMESLFEFSKLIPAFRERVSRADIDIVLNEHIKSPQQGDDLLDDEQFVERWIMALEEIDKEEAT